MTRVALDGRPALALALGLALGCTGVAGGSGAGGGSAAGGGPGAGGGGHSYATSFPLAEDVVLEGGAWHHAGLDWAVVSTTSGCAHSTQTGNAYDDAYALLSGFSPDQWAEGVIHLAPGYEPGGATHEVEIILRASDAAHDIHWYECNLSWGGAWAQIMRLDGPLGTFQEVTSSSNPRAPKDGDVFRCSATGNLIVSSLNGVELSRAVDSAFPTGQPGMGFFIRPGATASSYCFSSFAAGSQ